MIPAAFLATENGLRQPGNPQEHSTTATDPQANASTSQALYRMQERFSSAVQAAGPLDPGSAEYQELWDKQRRESDDRFSSIYGGDAFIKTQLDANKAAATAK